MKKIIIWGYGYSGGVLFEKLKDNESYKVMGFADNSSQKNSFYVDGNKILDINECKLVTQERDISVMIASERWFEIGLQLEKYGIPIDGVFINDEIKEYKQLHFEDIAKKDVIKLYAGDICDDVNLKDLDLIGLSINKGDERHIFHDITQKYPLEDNSVSSYVAEHVLEHIEYERIPSIVDEIYRILKKGAKLRICLPDYNSRRLRQRSMCDKQGSIIFDAVGGGKYINGKVGQGGHLWFPTYSLVNEILDITKFRNIEFVRYRLQDGNLVEKNYDNSKEYLYRMSMSYGDDANLIVDCVK